MLYNLPPIDCFHEMKSYLHKILSYEDTQCDNKAIIMNYLKNMNAPIPSHTGEDNTKPIPSIPFFFFFFQFFRITKTLFTCY